MQKKQPKMILWLSIFSAIHILLVTFYPNIQAFMNGQGRLLLFFMISNISRGLFLLLIALAGFTCLRNQKKFLPFYLGLFLFNLFLFFLV